MAELDTTFEHFTPEGSQQEEMLATPINEEMEDHDFMMHHVAQGDAGLYALDCCLRDLLIN